jgi:5'-methylthioadenosine phosphorylase
LERPIRIGIIGGTGLETALRERLGVREVRHDSVRTPFGAPSAPIATGVCGDADVALLSRHGPEHQLNPRAVPYRANVFALRALGCTHLVAFGATGSLREEITPGDLVICDQLIDRTEGRERTFFERAAVHVEFADPFCPVLRRWLLEAARSLGGLVVHERGTYVCIEGPAFSTRAESHMHRRWGADIVGMTALPEARLAREAEMAYALLALPTDWDCWRPRTPGAEDGSLLPEIMANLRRATEASMRLLAAALRDASALRATPSPAHEALRLAIWSDRSAIDPAEIERLRPLWGRYFDA